jgi:hypothetical protein
MNSFMVRLYSFMAINSDVCVCVCVYQVSYKVKKLLSKEVTKSHTAFHIFISNFKYIFIVALGQPTGLRGFLLVLWFD